MAIKKINTGIFITILLLQLIVISAVENNPGGIDLDNAVSMKGITSDEEVTISSQLTNVPNNQNNNILIIIIICIVIIIIIALVVLYKKSKPNMTNQ